MDLKNGAITVKEILSNPAAVELVKKYLPGVLDNKLLVTMAKSWTLNQILSKAGDKVDADTKAKLQKELEAL
jgi:hypothetical protein